MRRVEQRPVGSGRTAVTGREDGRAAPTVERTPERPPYEGLFREPVWPPEDDEAEG
jgi:hypothetical protein